MNVANIMTKNPLTCYYDDNISLLMHNMLENRIRHMIVKNYTNFLVGVFSINDIPKYPKTNLLAEYIMVKNPMVIDISFNIDNVLLIFKKLRIGCLPVLENNNLVGIITKSDLNKIIY